MRKRDLNVALLHQTAFNHDGYKYGAWARKPFRYDKIDNTYSDTHFETAKDQHEVAWTWSRKPGAVTGCPMPNKGLC